MFINTSASIPLGIAVKKWARYRPKYTVGNTTCLLQKETCKVSVWPVRHQKW